MPFLFMRALVLLLFVFSFISKATAQKLVKKAVLNPHIEYIQVDTKNCYQVDMKTSFSNELSVSAVIDGEYKRDIVVHIAEEGKTVLVTTGFQPNFITPNDKLSAHKVISIALAVTVPQFTDVQLYGNSSNVYIEGAYKRLRVSLADGSCILNKVIEDVSVQTQQGAIFAKASSGVVQAQSSYGRLHLETIPKGGATYRLSSIEGDIHLEKIE
ncbi:MAG: hypothetical protein AAGB24_00860 [Bacteroidota bacterium]